MRHKTDLLVFIAIILSHFWHKINMLFSKCSFYGIIYSILVWEKKDDKFKG